MESPDKPKGPRILDREGRPTMQAHGLRRTPLDDVYHTLLTTSWPRLLLLLSLGYLVATAGFAVLYALGGDCIVGTRPGHPEDYFFFSVHTLSTTGYGTMSPGTFYANLVATFEVMTGLLMVAILAGLAFAKFSQPRARVLWSETCVVRNFDGIPTLMFRMANQRKNQIVDARLMVNAVVDTVSKEGERLRRFVPMRLTREASPLFAMSWTAMHPIDETSPLFGLDRAAMEARKLEILVSFIGTDDTLHQTVHARTSYPAEAIRFGHRFVDVIEDRADGTRWLRYDRFHDVEPLGPT